MTLWLIEVATDVTEMTCFLARFLCLCTRKVPFELKLQLELAVCDSDIWFMFFPTPFLGSVISFLLQNHSSWEFPLAFFKFPASHKHPHLPAALRSAIQYKFSSGLSLVCVCLYIHMKNVPFPVTEHKFRRYQSYLLE